MTKSILTVGCSIGSCNGVNVVINSELKKAYTAQPGRQDWVTVIECISASGMSISPYVIFKGEHLVSSWIPMTPPTGWQFTTNISGWTNNFHGIQWIQHFDKATSAQLTSPDEYRLVLCDGHDSHVSGAVAAYCLQHKIILALLPPHSSHLLQPLDVGIFAPLKMAISQRQTQLYRSGFRRIQKVEWLEHYIEARRVAITEKNVLSAWRGAGLFPENMFRVLHQLPTSSSASTPLQIENSPPCSTSTPLLLTSSPPEPSTLRIANQNCLSTLASIDVNYRIKTHVRRLSGIAERLQTEVTILRKELHELKAVHSKRKEQASSKRLIPKGKTIVSIEELQKALSEAEKATKLKKGAKKRKSKTRVVGSDDASSDHEGGFPDSVMECLNIVDPEILDCIEVAL